MLPPPQTSPSSLFLCALYPVVVDYGGRQESEVWGWASLVSTWLAQRVDYATLLLNLVFVNPPDLPEQTCHALPVRYGNAFVKWIPI